MKKLAVVTLLLILFSYANGSNNSASKVSPKSFQQITYLLDTIADKYVYKELQSITDVSLNEKGEIISANQTRFSYNNQDGIAENTKDIYSPQLFWYGSEFESIYNKYTEQTLTDTLIKDGEYTFQYDKNSRLISFTQHDIWYQIHFIYDQHGQWTQTKEHLIEERSGHITYKITEREIQYGAEPIKSVNPTYLTVNGENLFEKKKRSIVDYYVLLQKAAIFIPDNRGGMFDVPNGFFEYEDEGTGGGVSTGQLAIFRTKDGKDILAVNAFSVENIGYPCTSGIHPKFYLFGNNLFTEIPNIFPEVNIQMFYDSGYTGSVEGILTYFTLPREGLSIQYNISKGLRDFCKELDSKNDHFNDYKEICDRYFNVKRTSIDIAFDIISGTFNIKN